MNLGGDLSWGGGACEEIAFRVKRFTPVMPRGLVDLSSSHHRNMAGWDAG